MRTCYNVLMSENTARKPYIDFLRILATFLVIFNHLPGNYLYETKTGVAACLFLFLSCLTKVNVPIFFMISGSVLLGKDEDVKTIFRKRILRFVLVIFVFVSAAYFLQLFRNNIMLAEKQSFQWNTFLLVLVDGEVKIVFQYWYLYAYLGLLLMLPFLRGVVKNLQRDAFILLIIIRFVIGALHPAINGIFAEMGQPTIDFNYGFSVPLAMADTIFFPIVGYYLDHKIVMEKVKRKHIAILGIGGLLCIGVAMAITLLGIKNHGISTESYIEAFRFLPVMFVFLFVKWFFYKKPVKEKTVTYITTIGGLTFGIFLLDPFLEYLLYNRYATMLLEKIPVLLISYGWCICSMVLGGCITLGLKKIPGVKKLF